MKKLFTCLLLSGLNYLNAQVVSFQESFTSAIPGTWTNTRVDNGTPITTGWSTQFAPIVATNQAFVQFGGAVYSCSAFNPANTAADRWLITPQQMNLPANSFLLFDVASTNNTKLENYEIRIATTNNLDSFKASPLNLLYVQTSESNMNLSTRIVDLSAWAGKNVYIAFRNIANNKFLLNIDNVKISTLLANDIQALGTNTHLFYNKDESPTFTLYMRNLSKNTLTSFKVNYSIDNGPAQSITESSGSFGPYAQFQYLFTGVSFSVAGTHNMKIWINTPNNVADENPVNDTIKFTYHVSKSGVAKKTLIEEFTGSWCGYCPEGAFSLNNIIKQGGGKNIGIAVHGGTTSTSSDRMIFAKGREIDTAYASGYPSFNANRYFFFEAGNTGISFSRTQLDGYVSDLSLLNTPAAVSIKNFAYDTTTRKATFDFETVFNDNFSGDFRPVVYVVEDSLKGSGSGWDQVNYYSDAAYPGVANNSPFPGDPDLDDLPSPIQGWYHRHVLRDVVTPVIGDAGVIPTTIVANTTYSKNYTVTLAAGVNPAQTHIVCAVQNNSASKAYRQILNSEEVKVMTKKANVAVNSIDNAIFNTIEINPNPVKDIAKVQFDLKNNVTLNVELFNIAGTKVLNVENGFFNSGIHTVGFDCSNLANGAYVLRTSDNLGNVENVKLVVNH